MNGRASAPLLASRRRESRSTWTCTPSRTRLNTEDSCASARALADARNRPALVLVLRPRGLSNRICETVILLARRTGSGSDRSPWGVPATGRETPAEQRPTLSSTCRRGLVGRTSRPSWSLTGSSALTRPRTKPGHAPVAGRRRRTASINVTRGYTLAIPGTPNRCDAAELCLSSKQHGTNGPRPGSIPK